jgi:Flp pilus assembly protein TadG
MQSPRSSGGNRRGATVVEFAICFPILLAFVFGTIEFSRVLQLQHTIRLAAFEGARAGVPLDSTTSDVTARTQSVLSSVRVTHATTTITPNPVVYASPTVTVTVSVDPTRSSWVNWFLTAGHPLTSTITLNREVLSVSVPGP